LGQQGASKVELKRETSVNGPKKNAGFIKLQKKGCGPREGTTLVAPKKPDINTPPGHPREKLDITRKPSQGEWRNLGVCLRNKK